MEAAVQTLRKSFATHKTLSLKWRTEQLNAMLRLITENNDELCAAAKKDLNKHSHETVTMELAIIKNSIIHSLNHLSDWMKPQKTTPIIQFRPLYSTFVEYQPLGVVLVIGAWNYPYQGSSFFINQSIKK